MGLGHIGHGVGMGGGAHTGLIGEQAPLDALADGGLQGIADAAADDGVGHESVLEDHTEGLRQVLDPADQQHQAAQQVQHRHDGHHLFRDAGNTLDAAQKDEHSHQSHQQAHHPGGHAEGRGAGGADGVGLHHAAHEAQGQDDGHGEEAGQELAQTALHGLADVVHGAAGDAAVVTYLTGLLGQHRLGIDGGHAEESDDPHPEDGAGAADEDGAAGAHDVAGAHLSGDGGGQRLEGAEAAVVLAAVHAELLKDRPHPFAEAADLHKAGLDGEQQARADQQHDQDVVRQVKVDFLHDAENGVHFFLSPLKSFNQTKKSCCHKQQLQRKQTYALSHPGKERPLSFCLRDSADALHLRHSSK